MSFDISLSDLTEEHKRDYFNHYIKESPFPSLFKGHFDVFWHELMTGNDHHFVIMENGKIIGFCEIKGTEGTTGEIGIELKGDERGRKKGTNALKELIKRARNMGYRELIWKAESNNIPSIKLISSMGGIFVRTEEFDLSSLVEDTDERTRILVYKLPADM